MAKARTRKHLAQLEKAPTGIRGLDEVTNGGLPKGRPTLVCGGAGSGKTLMSMEFLVRGATQFGEPGVFISFEETSEELVQNVASLGFDLKSLCASKRLVLDFVRSSGARSKRPVSTTLRGCSSGSGMPSIRSAPSGLYSIRSNRSSQDCPILSSSVPSFGASSGG